jgi:hypothetical protein
VTDPELRVKTWVCKAAPRGAAWSILATLCVGLLASGCSVHACVGTGCGTKTLDSHQAEAHARTAIAQGSGAQVRSVTCPPKIPVKAGSTFRCTATGADGSAVTVLVTQRNGRGDLYYSDPYLWHSGAAVQVIQRQLAQHAGKAVVVRCPDLVDVHKGTIVVCRVRTSTGATRKLTLRFTDDKGSFRF